MREKKNALEWTVFGLSLIVIAAAVALLAMDALSPHDVHPDLRVTTGAPVRSSGGYAVPVTVSNHGDATAEQARIEIALVSGGEEVEAAELTIAFVPRKSERKGWVVFRRNPSCCTVEARAVAYERP